mgnify:CR=1 FL=1
MNFDINQVFLHFAVMYIYTLYNYLYKETVDPPHLNIEYRWGMNAVFLDNKEVDFVAIKQNKKIYFQVSDDISNQKTFDREVTSLLEIQDAYPKILLASTHHDEYQYEGVKIIDIEEWLKL